MPTEPATPSEPGLHDDVRHPRVAEPVTLVVVVILSAFGALIGLHMITTLGVTANTSIIGALLAMTVGRIAIGKLVTMRSPHRQNLAQTSVSAATFGAANSLLTPLAVLWAFGRPDLVWPMLVGVVLALLVDAFMLLRLFGSRALPAEGAWPPGVAAAETIRAGDQGGTRAKILGGAGAVGLVGSLLGLPMSAAGVAFIGNAWALGMFGVGLLTAQYSPALLGVDLSDLHIPHGLMIGAGLVALVQAVAVLLRRRGPAGQPDDPAPTGAPDADLAARRTLVVGFGLFVGGAVLLALLTGILAELSPLAMLGWVLFAGVAALVHELIVGLAAMHAGWFPAFAVTLIFLIAGLLMGMPALPLAVLTGYCAATGPAFADMGYDFKAGWLLRAGHPSGKAFELAGRRQQFLASLIGFAAAAVVVALLWRTYFEAGDVPPVAEVYATTIAQGLTDPSILLTLLLWAIPGALVQLVGGGSRQLGVLLATGLLVATANAGWIVLAALLIRYVYVRTRGPEGQNDMALVGAGLIAGDAVAATSKVVQ